MKDMLKRSRALPLAGLLAGLLVGCGVGAPPHSDYYVVTFLAETPALSQEGLTALDNAAREAASSTPSAINIDVPSPAQGAMPALTRQRIAVIAKEFAQNGVDPRLVHNRIRMFDPKALAARENGFVIQLAYGP